jgi:two-component system cell cycle response regulator DivK
MNDKPTILYIEDNEDNLKLVNRVLQATGFNFHGAADGQAALAFLAEETPDLILMDINLPDIDGYTMTRQLRRRAELAEVPIVALTANVMKADRDKSIAAGCDGFIQKPISVDRLPQQVRSFLT